MGTPRLKHSPRTQHRSESSNLIPFPVIAFDKREYLDWAPSSDTFIILIF